MAQISRPFQIGLVAVVLLAGVWLFALRGHSSSSEPSTAAPASAPSTSHAAPSAPGSSAPGVAGLSNDVAKARGAVATSEKNAHQLEQKSAQASGESAPGASHTGSSPALGATTLAKIQAAGRRKLHEEEASGLLKSHTSSPSRSSAGKQKIVIGRERQQEVEAKLVQGSVAVILFWDPSGADDKAVQRSLHLLASVHKFFAPLAKRQATQRLLKAHGLELDKSISVFEASADEVASFGSITRGVQIYGTPTLVVVGPSRQAHVVTGLTDAYSIEQAIEEARHS
jgi:hypothetical protein